MSTTLKTTRSRLAKGLELQAGQWHNVVLVPEVECLRLLGLFFDTNKSFILPSTLDLLKQVPKQLERHPDGELVIFGHTDTSGEPNINDPLSARRAEAVMAYLMEDIDAWLAMYGSSVPDKQRWGAREDFLMIAQVPGFAQRPRTLSPVRWYQSQKAGALAVDGIAGPKTRRALIADYMALDASVLPASVQLTAIGCGEDFPLDDTGQTVETNPDRNKRDALDRRVELFFFNSFTEEPPPKTREAYPQWVKRSTTLKVVNGGTEIRVVRLRLLEAGTPLKDKEYFLSAGGRVIAGGTLSDDGRLEAVLTGAATEVTVDVPDAGLQQTLKVLTQPAFPSADTVLGAQLRLANLGYYGGPADGERTPLFDAAVANFRESQGLEPTSALDAETANKLKEAYGS